MTSQLHETAETARVKADRFVDLVQSHYAAVETYARRRMRGPDVEDLVMDVFTVAWRRLTDIPRGHELAWLYRTAQLSLANVRRGDGRRRELRRRLEAQPRAADGQASVEEPAVVVALGRLRPEDQELLRLVAWEELPYGEIARVLGVTENAVAIRVHRARQRLEYALRDIGATAGIGRLDAPVRSDQTGKEHDDD